MSDLRERFSSVLDELSDEAVRGIVGGLEASKTIWVDITCKKRSCQHKARYAVDVPDWDKRGKLLEILLNQAKGRPAQTIRAEVTVKAKPVTDMSLAELEAEEARILAEHPELQAG